MQVLKYQINQIMLHQQTEFLVQSTIKNKFQNL